MRTFAEKQNRPQRLVAAIAARPKPARRAPDDRQHRIHLLQRTIGNQAVLRMLRTNNEEGPNVRSTSSSMASPRVGNGSSGNSVHPPASGVIQTKLAINQPGDEYEQEADRIPDRLMRMPTPQLQLACACGGECVECQKEQPKHRPERLQTKRVGPSDSGQVAAPPSVNRVLASPGQALDASIRAEMEPRFGHDFSGVRVHSSAAAEQSAQDVDAKAYTVGHHIVFRAGQFAPTTREGQRLLAHELTHVLQQSGAEGNGASGSNENHGLSSTVMSSEPRHAAASGQGTLQRESAENEEPKPLLEPLDQTATWSHWVNSLYEVHKEGDQRLEHVLKEEWFKNLFKADAPVAESLGAMRELGVVTLLSPLQIGLGILGIIEGVEEGGEKGIKHTITGGLDVVSGGAGLLAPVAGGLATTVGVGAAGAAMGLEIGDAGITELKEHGVDPARLAADIGRSLARIPVVGPLAGIIGTFLGSVAMTPVVGLAGLWRVTKNLFHGIETDPEEIYLQLHPPRADIGPEHEQIGPTTQVAYETVPPPRDPSAVLSKSRRRSKKAEVQNLRQALKQFRQQLAAVKSTRHHQTVPQAPGSLAVLSTGKHRSTKTQLPNLKNALKEYFQKLATVKPKRRQRRK